MSNPIRKQRGRLATHVNTGAKVRTGAKWYAICPDCGERIHETSSWLARTSRKTVKDALHRHQVYVHSKPSLARIQV